VGWFAWATAHMTWISFELDDVSQGLVPVKLWIPQSAMALGLWILLIALLDDFVLTLRGRTPSYAVPHAHDDGGTTFER
jgi:TRAP-type C4-dicarboxylate transport system permease small subunit